MTAQKIKQKDLTVVHLAGEFFPYSKTGGLANVVSELTASTRALGVKVAVVLPLWGGVLERLGEYETIANDFPIKVDENTTFTASFIHKKLIISDASSLDLYFINHYDFFGRYRKNFYSHPEITQRFYFFSLAALELLKLQRIQPDLVHGHDWMVGLVPQIIKFNYQDYFERRPKTLITIHNLAFQGSSYVNANKYTVQEKIKSNIKLPKFSNKEAWQKINFLRRGVYFADKFNTISERYAKEIITPTYGEGMQGLLKSKGPIIGILNGINYKLFNPQTSSYLYKSFNSLTVKAGKLANKKKLLTKYLFPAKSITKPLIVMVHRITEQKGFDLMVKSIDVLMQLDLTMMVLGEGDPEYVKRLQYFERRYNKKFRFINRMSESMEHRLDAAADFFLAPSHFEPCGTAHLKAMSYGAVPIARRTGGLVDTIYDYSLTTNSGNGILFANIETPDLVEAVKRGLAIYTDKPRWNEIVKRNMLTSFSWEKPALAYYNLYQTMLATKEKIIKK